MDSKDITFSIGREGERAGCEKIRPLTCPTCHRIYLRSASSPACQWCREEYLKKTGKKL